MTELCVTYLEPVSNGIV